MKLGRGGGIVPPVIFIALVVTLDTSDLDQGRRDGGGGEEGTTKNTSPSQYITEELRLTSREIQGRDQPFGKGR